MTTAESEILDNDIAAAGVCGLRPEPEPEFAALGGDHHIRAIIEGQAIWVNGTVLRYYFYDRPADGPALPRADGTRPWVTWVGPDEQREVVRSALSTSSKSAGTRSSEVLASKATAEAVVPSLAHICPLAGCKRRSFAVSESPALTRRSWHRDARAAARGRMTPRGGASSPDAPAADWSGRPH